MTSIVSIVSIHLGRNSENFSMQIRKIFTTLGLKNLEIIVIKCSF